MQLFATPRPLLMIMIMFPMFVTAPAIAATDSISGSAIQSSHGMAMHGNLKYQDDFKNFDYVNPDAPKGGAVKLNAIGTFDSFNGFIIKGNPATGLGFLYESLMTSAADEAFSQYGQLAEKITVPKDRSWAEFLIRKQARWQDGKPVTPEDVIWTYNTLTTKGSPFFRFYYAGVKNVVKVGERSVRFNFKAGDNRELPLIVGEMTILPKHYWADKEFDKTTLTPPLGSGPYTIDKFESGRFITFKRDKNWWGQSLPVNVGRYNIDSIRFDYYRDTTVALEAFKAGEYDYRAESSSKNWATAYDLPNVKKGYIKTVEIQHNRSSGMQGFVYNTRRNIFKDRRVRQALAYAFDFEWSNKNLFYSQYTRTRSYFDNSELAATGLPNADELKLLEPWRGQIPGEVFSKSYMPPKTDGSGIIRSNLRKASKILRSAGWVIKDGKRINEKTGQALDFEVLLVSPLFERIALPMAENLKKLGITLRVRTVDASQYRRRLDTYDYDMIVSSYGQSLSPGNEQRNYWGSGSADIEGGRNFIGIKDKAIDAMIEKIISAKTRTKLITATKAMDRILQWNYFVIPNWHIPYDRLAYWNKFGRPKTTPSRGNQFTAWWIDADLQQALPGNRSRKTN